MKIIVDRIKICARLKTSKGNESPTKKEKTKKCKSINSSKNLKKKPHKEIGFLLAEELKPHSNPEAAKCFFTAGNHQQDATPILIVAQILSCQMTKQEPRLLSKCKSGFDPRSNFLKIIVDKNQNCKKIKNMKPQILKIESLGNYDCYGNIGSVKTKNDLFIFNGSSNIPWLRRSDNACGTIKFNKNYSKIKFTQI